MNWLNKLPGFQRSESGLEWKLWRRLPLIWLVGSALPALVALTAWLGAPEAPDGTAHRALTQLYYTLIGVVVLHWTLVFTVAIGCVVVMLMKGPAYGADGYSLNDSELPAAARSRRDGTP